MTSVTVPKVQEVADKIYKFRLPMPARLDHINVYLVRESKRIAMIDTGLPTPEAWQVLNDCLEQVGMKFGDVTDIFVTHSHPDHIGLLSKVRRAAPDARLHMHRRELSLLQERADNPTEMEKRMRDWLLYNGATELAEKGTGGERLTNPEIKPDDHVMDGGEIVQLGDGPEGAWEIMWTPGHTAGHFVLHNRTRRMMLSGDHLLGQISSNVGKYPGSTADPLGDYLSSLNKIAELELQHVFPAHGLPFEDYRARAADLLHHHELRLDKMCAAVENQPRTAAEVVKIIWGDKLQGFDRFLALVETLSHMERLMRDKRVVADERDNKLYFRAV